MWKNRFGTIDNRYRLDNNFLYVYVYFHCTCTPLVAIHFELLRFLLYYAYDTIAVACSSKEESRKLVFIFSLWVASKWLMVLRAVVGISSHVELCFRRKKITFLRIIAVNLIRNSDFYMKIMISHYDFIIISLCSLCSFLGFWSCPRCCCCFLFNITWRQLYKYF